MTSASSPELPLSYENQGQGAHSPLFVKLMTFHQRTAIVSYSVDAVLLVPYYQSQETV